MIKFFSSRWVIVVVLSLLLFAGFPLSSYASHLWNNYHWARTSNPLTLNLGDNVSSGWDPYLNNTTSDWTVSGVVYTSIVTGSSTSKNCRPTGGRVEVCNSKYGSTGWLGIAQIWINADHIYQGVVKLNDTYFNSVKYNKPEWRQLVMCQEVGHTLGLDHQDEIVDNKNLGTCMDYTNDPSGSLYNQLSNQHPNQHDYEELAYIYAHTDSSTTTASFSESMASGEDLNSPAAWGKRIRKSADGRLAVYERDLGKGHRIITHVFWDK